MQLLLNRPRGFLALSALLLLACSDDDPAGVNNPPAAPLWQEVDLGETPGESGVFAVDFTGDQGVVVRLSVPPVVPVSAPPDEVAQLNVTHEFFRLQADGSWLLDNPDSLRSEFLCFDLAVDNTGELVLAGFQYPGPPAVVVDLRGATPAYIEQSTFGMLTVDGEGSFMVAGGRSQGGGLWTSVAPGSWNFDDLPLTGTNDSGFEDVYIRGDTAVACGYDDGADTLQVILRRTTTTGWEKVPLSGTFGKTFLSVALSEAGTIFVGGINGAGGPAPEAFLSQRSAAGDWVDLILPDPQLLLGVMDILIAADGSIYLACQGEGSYTMANLIHADASGVRKEITPFPGGLLQLGQAAGGDIYAVGIRRDDVTGMDQGVMLVKKP